MNFYYFALFFIPSSSQFTRTESSIYSQLNCVSGCHLFEGKIMYCKNKWYDVNSSEWECETIGEKRKSDQLFYLNITCARNTTTNDYILKSYYVKILTELIIITLTFLIVGVFYTIHFFNKKKYLFDENVDWNRFTHNQIRITTTKDVNLRINEKY